LSLIIDEAKDQVVTKTLKKLKLAKHGKHLEIQSLHAIRSIEKIHYTCTTKPLLLIIWSHVPFVVFGFNM
jgi:hypothetical protein